MVGKYVRELARVNKRPCMTGWRTNLHVIDTGKTVKGFKVGEARSDFLKFIFRKKLGSSKKNGR